MNLENELNVSIDLAKRAGEAILEIYNSEFDVEFKEDHSPLTLADKKSNEIIIEGLAKSFPQYSILSEESVEDPTRHFNDWCWVVDPLDGTKEFIKRNGEFTVNIALTYKHKVILGVIYVPVNGEVYYAVKGQGAFLEKNGHLHYLNVSDAFQKIRLVCSRSHVSDKLQMLIEENRELISDIISAGSSLKGCLVARGEAEVYYRFGPTMEWDTAAMQCIAEESGAIFRQMDGSEMLYNREDSLNNKGFYILNRKENFLLKASDL